MNVTCFYDQTPFTLSMEEKTAALRKMHAENLHHYDARCPRCGRANAISRERLEMFTPGWEEAIKAPATPAMTPPKPVMPTPAMSSGVSPVPAQPSLQAPAAAPKRAPSRRKHAPAAKKAPRKAKPAAKRAAKKVAKKPSRAKTRSVKKSAAARKTARKTTKTRSRKK